jgi:hypothetical protein
VEPLYCRGDYVEIRVLGSDPDGDRLRYAIDPASDALPTGLTLGACSGRIRGILRRTNDEGSSTGYDVVVVASDPGGLSGSVAFHLFSIACEEPRISRFVLVDAKRERDIRMLVDGDVLSLHRLPRHLSIRVDAYPETLAESFYGGVVESVRFELDGQPVRTENQPPYSLGGDVDGDYATFPLRHGLHTLTATPYDANHGGGTQGLPRSIDFRVIK